MSGVFRPERSWVSCILSVGENLLDIGKIALRSAVELPIAIRQLTDLKTMNYLSASGFVICGGLLGYLLAGGFSPKHEIPSHPGADGSGQARPDRRQADVRIASPGFRDIARAPAKEIPSLMQRAASTADPIERQRWVSECLSQISAENWQEVVSSFAELSDETGRDMASEWTMALVRSGQVAGAEAMDAMVAAGLGGNGKQCWNILYGWGMKDPKAALEWLKQAESAGKAVTSEHFTALLAGAALARPADALALLDQMPPDRKAGCAGHLAWNIVMNGGTEALPQLLDYAAKLDHDQPGNEALSRSLIREAAERMLWQSDHKRSVPGACDAVKTLISHGADPTGVASQALQKYRWYAVPDRLALLDGMISSNEANPPDARALTSSLASTLGGGQDVEAVRKWIAQNPRSPIVPHLKERFGEEIPLPSPEAE